MVESSEVQPETRNERTRHWLRSRPAQSRLFVLLVLIPVACLWIAWQAKQLRKSQVETRERAERSASNAQLARVLNLLDRNPSVAEQILTQIPVSQRDLAWGILQHRLTTKVTRLDGHRDLVADLCFSPDSSQLASVDLSGTIRLWDAGRGMELKTLFHTEYEWSELDLLNSGDLKSDRPKRLGSFAPASHLQFSASGRFLAARLRLNSGEFLSNRPVKLLLFDLQTDDPPLQFDGVSDFDFSAKEELIAMHADGNILLRWLQPARELAVPVPKDFGIVTGLEFRAAGSKLVAVSSKNTFLEVTVAAEATISKSPLQISRFPVIESWLSPDGALLLAIEKRPAKETVQESANHVDVYFLVVYSEELTVISEFELDGLRLWNVEWMSDGRHFILPSGFKDRLFRVDSDKIVEVHDEGGPGGVGDGFFVWTSDESSQQDQIENTFHAQNVQGKTILSAAYRTDWVDRPNRHSIRRPPKSTTATISRNGQFLAAADGSRRIHLWRLTPDRIEWTSSGHSAEIFSIQFSEDGSRFFTIDRDGSIVARDVSSGQVQFESKLPAHDGPWNVRVYGDSNRVVVHRGIQSGDRKPQFPTKECYVWDLLKNQIILSGQSIGVPFRGPDDPTAFLSRDGKSLVFGELPDNVVGVWDTDSGKERFRITVSGELRNSLVRADGKILTLAVSDGGCVLSEWDLTNGRQISARRIVGLNSKEAYLGNTHHQSRFLSLKLYSSRYFYDLHNDCLLAKGHYVTPSGEVVNLFRRTLTAGRRGQEILSVPLATDGVRFHFDGPTMISLNQDATLSFWDAGRGEEQLRIPTESNSLRQVCVSPRRDAVVLVDDSGRVAIVRVSVPSKTE